MVKTDIKKFVNNVVKTTTPNDWIIARTKNKETYLKIAEMICEYGNVFWQQAHKERLAVYNMNDDFNKKLKSIIKRFV